MGSEGTEARLQPIVIGTLDRRRPLEPRDLLALTFGRARVGRSAIEEVAKIEMGVPATAGMHIDVHQPRHAATSTATGTAGVGTHIGELDVETGLLLGLPAGGDPGRLPRVDVPTGLQPEAQSLVPEQHHTTRPDDDRRTGDVHRVERLVERVVETVELDQERGDARRFGSIDRVTLRDRTAHLLTEVI